MAYSTVDDIYAIGRLSMQDAQPSEVEEALLEAQLEVERIVPPIAEDEPGYDRYITRLPLIERAHAYLTIAYVYRRLPFETIRYGKSGDPLGISAGGGGIDIGPRTPEINVEASFYRSLANDYEKKAYDMLKKCVVRVPTIKRPQPLDL